MIAELLSRRLVLVLPLLLWTGAPLHAGDMAEPGLALNGVAHVAFRVADLPQSTEFSRRLGWEQALECIDGKGMATSYVKVTALRFVDLYRLGAHAEAPGLL